MSSISSRLIIYCFYTHESNTFRQRLLSRNGEANSFLDLAGLNRKALGNAPGAEGADNQDKTQPGKGGGKGGKSGKRRRGKKNPEAEGADGGEPADKVEKFNKKVSNKITNLSSKLTDALCLQTQLKTATMYHICNKYIVTHYCNYLKKWFIWDRQFLHILKCPRINFHYHAASWSWASKV